MALVSVAFAQPVALVAQVFPSNVPYGSPLDPLGQQSNGQSYQAQGQAQAAATPVQEGIGRIEPVRINDGDRSDTNESGRDGGREGRRSPDVTDAQSETRKLAAPSEFERFVEKSLGRSLPRFGANLLIPASRDFSLAATATVPSDYVLNPGDRIFIGLTGSVEGTVDAEIDSNGRIFIPKVGSIRVAGTTFGGLRALIQRAAGTQYRDFRVSASVTRLRGIRVYVTGFANNPGAYTVSSLSTMVNAVLAAGGPSAGGSFRTITLRRAGQVVRDFDLYDLLRNGDRSKDAVLQNEDVLYIPPVGRQIAITGSVNDEAIYEAKPNESLESLLQYAGGTNALADKSRVILYRLSNLDTVGGVEVTRSALAAAPADGGDLVQVLSAGSLTRSLERQSVVVRIEGEVAQPGNYYVAPNTTLAEALALAGGTTRRAFIYGTNVQRLSVRQQQRASFNEAIQQFEISIAATPLAGEGGIDAATRAAQIAAARNVVERLRQAEPDGRVVLNLTPTSSALPGGLTLENSDRIYVPPVPSTVGVFGAVYRPASFLSQGVTPLRVRDYIQKAGGPLRAADKGQIFVIRANGEVLTKRSGGLNALVVPGDVVFVPVKTSNARILDRILQFGSLFFQLGLTAATVVAVSN